MNSVYFPTNVVLIFRRLINVVSSLSISNHYIQHRQEQNNNNTDTGPGAHKWPWHSLKDRDPNVLNTALNLPEWTPRNWHWSNMFSSFQPEINIPPPDDLPPPSIPPRRNHPSPRRRQTPSTDPWELHKYKEVVKPIEPDHIHQLLRHPTLFDPIRTPRYPIVLCHGLYGFDSRGPSSFPSMRMHYWQNVLRVLRGRVGAEVIVTSVPGTGSISSRASRLDQQLQERARGRGVNFLAHSMGGLDCRHLISHIRPSEYAPLSLTSICTPHRGSPFMDWCSSNIGIGKLREQEKEFTEELRQSHQRTSRDFMHAAQPPSESVLSPEKTATAKSESSAFSLSLSSLPSSFTTLLLSVVDSPAYANLRSDYLNNVFNPATPDDPRVKYWSVASRVSREQVSIWHPFWLPKMVLDGVEESEREKRRREWVKKTGRMNVGDRERWVGEETPVWANEREWGNDGLVTVQSAKWGEFLGIMEGCDHWEMRGARGIEFGVDLPAIPSIGLGTLYDQTTSGGRSDSDNAAAVSAARARDGGGSAQGDGWGFGDWTKFVNVWKTTKDEGTSVNSTLTNSTPVASKPDTSSTIASRQTAKEKEADDLLRASTEKLSAVFDWLIDIVPGGSVKGKESVGEARKETDSERMKQMSRAAIERTAGGGSSSSSQSTTSHSASASSSSQSSPPPSSPASSMKRRMDREDLGRRKNELGDRADLERFYVALARKMYDAGL